MAKVNIPEHIRQEFSLSTPWPTTRFSGEVEILLGLEELSLHPSPVERVGNLGIFMSPLSETAIMGGRHALIFPIASKLLQSCNLLHSAQAPSQQQHFRIKQMDNMFQLGDTMGDYIPKTCSNCRKCTTCTFCREINITEGEDRIGIH